MTTPAAALPARARRRASLWIALALLLANGLAWLRLAPLDLQAAAEPRLDPQIAAIREKLFSGQASGQRFEIVVTDQMASEAVAWFLARHPNVPFSHPRIAIDSRGVTAGGVAYILGLRTPVSGRAWVGTRDGRPQVDLQSITLGRAAAPDFILQAVQQEFQSQLTQAQALPVFIERVELGQGHMLIEGTYR